MDIQLTKTSLAEIEADMAFVGATQKVSGEKTEAVLGTADGGLELDRKLGGLLSTLIKDQEFSGGAGETLLVPTHGKIRAKYVLVVGCGKTDGLDLEAVRRFAGAAVQAANRIKAGSATGRLEPKPICSMTPAARLQAFTEGAALADYLFEHFREKKSQKQNNLSKIFVNAEGNATPLEAAVKKGLQTARGINYARELTNLPANIINPKTLAGEAKKLAARHKNISCRVLTGKELEKEKMFAIMAVGQGSATPPHFIHLKYTPPKKSKVKVAIVGKGVTFDSGGYNLKLRKMEEMKQDMAGASAVLGLFEALGTLKLPVAVEGFVAACENMVNGSAYRPSDIIRSRSGKSIEVLNTDAEGRLVLADALDFASDQKPDILIDMATLTGAAGYALGELITPVFCNDSKLWGRLKKAGELAGEPSWEMPLFQEYQKGYKNGPADLKNAGSGTMAGTIAGALFLQEFVKPGIAWAHMDIAFTAVTEKPLPYCTPKGGTGVPVRTLLYFMESL